MENQDVARVAERPKLSYSDDFFRAFAERGSEEFICRGHPVGELLEAWRWRIVSESMGRLSLRAPISRGLRNVKGQLFGGFTPTLLDLAGTFTVHAGEPKRDVGFPYWLSTINLRMDYFEPITSDEIAIESRVLKRRGRVAVVEVSFLDPAETLAAVGWVTVNVGDRGRQT